MTDLTAAVEAAARAHWTRANPDMPWDDLGPVVKLAIREQLLRDDTDEADDQQAAWKDEQ